MGIKKHSLTLPFIIFSLIAFILTGIILSLIISDHLRKDKYADLNDVTQLTIDLIISNNFTESDFNDIIPDSMKNDIIRNIKNAMISYSPKAITIYNSRKVMILSSETTTSSQNINNIELDKVLTSEIKFGISRTYLIKNTSLSIGEESVFDIYMPIKYKNDIAGVLKIQIPESVIGLHINMLVKSIVLTLISGLLILFILLINILYSASNRLYKQNIELLKQKNEIEASYKNTIYALSNAVDARDPYTAGHSARVAQISVLVGKTLNISDDELINIEYAALFHDIGKIGIPDNILNKEGKLTDDEFDVMKKHPNKGVNILQSIAFLHNTLIIIKHHHERYSGKGYPDGISGEDIPLGSRIIAIADTYDAMTSDRPYRKKLSHEIAVNEIFCNKGIQFDAKVVNAFMMIEYKIKK